MYEQPIQDILTVIAPAAVEQTTMDRLAFTIGNSVVFLVPSALIAFVTVFIWWLIFHRNTCNFRLWVQEGFAPFERTFLSSPQWVMHAELGKQKREMDEEKRKAIQQLKDKHEMELRDRQDRLQSEIQPLRDEKLKLEIMLREISWEDHDKVAHLESEHEKELSNLRKANDILKLEKESSVNEAKRCQDICEANEAKCKQLRNEHKSVLARTKANHDDKTAKLKSAQENQLGALRSKHEQKLKAQREQIRERATTPFHGIKNINMSRAQGKGVRRRDGGKYDPRLSAIIHKMRRKLEEEYEQKFKDRVEELRRQLEKDHRNQKPKGDSPAKRDDGDDDDDDDESGNDGKGGKGAIPDSQDLSGSPPAKEPDNSADDDQSRNDGQPVPGKPPSQEAHDSAENDQSRNDNQTTENSRPPADEPVAAGNHSVVEGEQTEGKQETSEEAEQTEAKNDTSEETKKTTSPDPFSPESRHFCTSPQSEASEDLPLESDDNSEGSSGDDANASMLSEILAPLTITEMVPVLGRAASSPPELPAPITSSPTPGNTATIPDAAPSTAEQSSDASFAPIVSSQNPASQSAEGQSADADMGLGSEQTANTNTVISSTGTSQNVASELAEGQSADIDMGLENEQTASSATGISSTASLPNPTSESAEGHSADVDMRLESEQTTTSSSTETKDEDQVDEATGEATEKVDEDMEDATAAAEAVTADAEMVDAPADPPVAVQAPATVAPPMMPTQPTAAPPPRASPFGTAMQWASGLYTPSTASPSYTKVVNTSQPVHPPPPRPSTAYSPLPRTTPPFPLHGINPKKVTYAASPSSADPWKKAPPSAPASPAAGPSSAPHYDPRRTMNRASPPAPASSTAAAGSAPLYDPLRRMDGGHPPAPWAPPPARPPGASPTNTPYHTSRPVQGIPWLGGASPPPSNWTSSGPSLGGSYEESGSPSGALTMPELSAITPRPTVPPRDPSTADNAGGLGSSNASRTSNAPVAQAGRRAPNSPAAGGHLGQTGVGNTPTRRPPYEVKKPSLTEAEKKQLAKDANLCFGKPKQRKPKPFIPSEPPRNLISTNGDPRFTLAQMYGTPISPSPPKSAPKRGNEETSDESNSKRQRSGVDDSEVNTSTSPNPDTGNPQSSNPGLKRARGDDEEDDAAENTKRRRSASGEAGEAAPTSAPANGASDSTVATPGQSSASTMKEEEEDLYGVSDDEEEGAAS